MPAELRVHVVCEHLPVVRHGMKACERFGNGQLASQTGHVGGNAMRQSDRDIVRTGQ